MKLSERFGLAASVLDKYEDEAMLSFGKMRESLTKNAMLALCSEGNFEAEHCRLVSEFMDFAERDEELLKLIFLHYYVRFKTDEVYFDNLWEGGLEDIPFPKDVDEKYPGMFMSIVYLLAVFHLKEVVEQRNMPSWMIDEYYSNFKRFAKMNTVTHDTYGLCRLASFVYCYAYPFIISIGRFTFQISRFKKYFDVYENAEGVRFFAARNTCSYNEDGYQDESAEFRPEITIEGNLLRAHSFDEMGRLTKEPRTIDLSEYKRTLTEGDIVVAIHIPADRGKLSPDVVEKSISDAKEFFGKYFSEWGIKAFTCHTWFIDPALRPVFGENSNTAAFADLFDIAVGPDQKLHSLFDHIFDVKPVPLSELVPKNRFQAEMLERAKQGIKMYWAYGVLKTKKVIV